MKFDFKNNYDEFLKYLFSFQDLKYKDFNKSIIINSKYEMIGIRLPIMRSIAKKIAKECLYEFLDNVGCNYYEEVMIQGLVIADIKEENVFYRYFKDYIKKIDNWGLCDSFCNSIKIVRKYEKKYFKESINMSLKKSEFISRVGIVTILNHFISRDNLSIIFDALNKIESNKFYVNMAQAWLICEMYTKFPDETKVFIENNNLNRFTQNKAISKIHDSYRVSKEDKDYLNNFRK